MVIEGCHCVCLSVILIDSVDKMGKYYYQQRFLEERKYNIKEINMSRFINDELEVSCDESGESDESDVEASDERTDKQQTFMGKVYTRQP